MSFGRNPHVSKAETAEQKARTARDEQAREQAWREAARQWERAANREADDKRRALYSEKAEAARNCADVGSMDDVADLSDQSDTALIAANGPRKSTLLN